MDMANQKEEQNIIKKFSDKMATSGVLYNFSDGVFKAPNIEHRKQNTYEVKNEDDNDH